MQTPAARRGRFALLVGRSIRSAQAPATPRRRVNVDAARPELQSDGNRNLGASLDVYEFTPRRDESCARRSGCHPAGNLTKHWWHYEEEGKVEYHQCLCGMFRCTASRTAAEIA